MVDLTPYKAQIQAANQKTIASTEEHMSLFLDHLHLQGFNFSERYFDSGTLYRLQDETDKGSKKSGWAIFNQGEYISVGIYGSWKQPDQKHVWYSKNESDLTFKQRIEINEKIKLAQEQQRIEREKKHEEASKNANDAFSNLENATDDLPYLQYKQVKAYPNTKKDNQNLVIPIIKNDVITSTQTIYPDGKKRFLTGGKLKGCYFILEGKQDTVYIAEGYSTGASIAEATECMVYIAFSAGNLYEVASHVKSKHNNVIVCGDNDDACHAKMEQIRSALHIECITPPSKYNDFNDWWVDEKQDLLDYFTSKKKAPKKCNHKELSPTENSKECNNNNTHNFKPQGVLQDIINYYNATAKRDQPLFAIQTAIATCSVILGRNFETNKENRTSLYLLNVAKSGTGKEHAKKITEKILEATNNHHLIAGDGYTSSSAVISACQERPRHITIIDEFSKYLQVSKNPNMGGHMADANAMLMQAFGRLEGKIRAKSRATIGLNKAMQKDLNNQFVSCPAITLMSMTTPKDFFDTIDETAIKDGFINRFIVCISDAERAIPNDKEPLEVPESIIEWINNIQQRKGLGEESAILDPNIIKIPFTMECNDIQREFHKYCIDLANKNEQFGLAEISGRSAEMAYRLALIIALSYDYNCSKIEGWHMVQAINWIKYNLDKTIKELKHRVSGSDHEASKKEILLAIRKSKGVSKTDMYKRTPFSKYKKKDLDDILTELFEAELIEQETEQTETAGRPRTIWKAL